MPNQPPPETITPEGYLEARQAMIELVKDVLADHRPERIKDQRVVTCTRCYDDEPHAVIKTQWPGWRDHVAPAIVDAFLKEAMDHA